VTLDEIVRHYVRTYREAAAFEMEFFESQASAASAIRVAASCIWPDGKRHPHQRRIPRAVLDEAESRLQAARAKIGRAADFDALHQVVKATVGTIRGIGDLTVYDITHRLGAYFGKEPAAVYLHAGTRAGAASFGLRGDRLDPAKLPATFKRLKPAEIEDCLCIYKDELSDIALRGHRPPSTAKRLGRGALGCAVATERLIGRPGL
jgi:hypothetical protein